MITVRLYIPGGCKALGFVIAEDHSITRLNIISCDLTWAVLEGFSKQFDIIKQPGSVTAYLRSASEGVYRFTENTTDILHILPVFFFLLNGKY